MDEKHTITAHGYAIRHNKSFLLHLRQTSNHMSMFAIADGTKNQASGLNALPNL